jgi:alcohol dehydrogenase (cytochrome c)
MHRPMKAVSWVGFLLVMSVVSLAGQRSAGGGITSQDLLDGLKDPTRWLTYSGDYSGRRHSPLTQITPENVRKLRPQWTFQSDLPALAKGIEATPIVLDGVLYTTGTHNNAWALDGRTGRPIWTYKRDLPPKLTACCGLVNRGFAILGDKLFMVTLDAHLLALDIKSGGVVWDTVLEKYQDGYAATLAPLVVKNKVIVGIAGGEYPTRGFIDAYDAESGKREWRFYTVPGAGEPGSETWPNSDVMARGGGSIWVTGSYDPQLNLVYFGTGNPNPDYWGDDRMGDNLYTDSLVALDADTGKLRWHYQFTPHDIHDWDATQIPVLADIPMNGANRKVVMFANRNGFFYTLDRTDGKLLMAKPFIQTGWAKEIGKDGRPVVLQETGTPEQCLPDQRGGTNFMSPSFDPVRLLLFVTATETCVNYSPRKPDKIVIGETAGGGSQQRISDGYAALRALDPMTGERRWEFRYPSSIGRGTLSLAWSGVLSTASGVVFAGDNEGNFIAFDARTGKDLWHYQTGWGFHGPPTTYMLDGRQWVVMPSGTTLTAYSLPDASQQ